MASLATLKFTIRHIDGSVEELSVDSDSALVGSGAHCEIRLPIDVSPVEQLQVEIRGEAVFAEARSMEPAALLAGTPFAQGRLLPDSLLQIGTSELQVELVASSDRPKVAQAKKEKTNPLILGAALIGFPLGAYMLFTMRPQESAISSPPEPPALFQSESHECVHQDAVVAEAQARADLLKADAKRERSPFYPADGVRAVELYQQAASCLQRAQKVQARSAIELEAGQLRVQVARQFHVHQVRLERALATKNYETARSEARLLSAYVGKQPGEYSSWLAELQRKIELKFSGRK